MEPILPASHYRRFLPRALAEQKAQVGTRALAMAGRHVGARAAPRGSSGHRAPAFPPARPAGLPRAIYVSGRPTIYLRLRDHCRSRVGVLGLAKKAQPARCGRAGGVSPWFSSAALKARASTPEKAWLYYMRRASLPAFFCRRRLSAGR